MIYLSESLKEQIEALLFATQGLSLDTISQKTSTPKNQVEKALKELGDDYSKRNTALTLACEGGVWKLTVHSKHVPLVKDLIPSEFPKSILETLAIIAYKNPAKQSEVIKIRGNKAYDHIKDLMKRELINSKPKGKTNELSLTDKFYEYFNANKDDLKKAMDTISKQQ